MQDAVCFGHWCVQWGTLLREAHDRGSASQAVVRETASPISGIYLHGLLLQKLETVNNSDFFQRFSYDVRCTLSSF